MLEKDRLRKRGQNGGRVATKMSNSLVILSLKEREFFFNPVARLVNGELEGLTRLWRSLKMEKKRQGIRERFFQSDMSCVSQQTERGKTRIFSRLMMIEKKCNKKEKNTFSSFEIVSV